MLSDVFFSALGLVFVLEGVLPFLSPDLWRRLVRTMAAQSDTSMRVFGLVMMVIGVVLLYLLHQ